MCNFIPPVQFHFTCALTTSMYAYVLETNSIVRFRFVLQRLLIDSVATKIPVHPITWKIIHCSKPVHFPHLLQYFKYPKRHNRNFHFDLFSSISLKNSFFLLLLLLDVYRSWVLGENSPIHIKKCVIGEKHKKGEAKKRTFWFCSRSFSLNWVLSIFVSSYLKSTTFTFVWK